LKKIESMVKEFKRPLSKNQQKILEILTKYQELTAKDIAEILWARNIDYRTPEYSSVHRSLTALCKRGLVLKVGGQLKWRRDKEIR
jgi:Fe2+ or Zn2+ uptake regulation protein